MIDTRRGGGTRKWLAPCSVVATKRNARRASPNLASTSHVTNIQHAHHDDARNGSELGCLPQDYQA
jgi:hypothetical protein